MSQEMRKLLDGEQNCSAGLPMHEYREGGVVVLYHHNRNGTRARCHGDLCRVVNWAQYLMEEWQPLHRQADANNVRATFTWAEHEGLSLLVVVHAGAALPMVLHCPQCSRQHIDEPNLEEGWLNPPHRTHKCVGCGCLWRPAGVPTTGVKELPREVK